MAGLIETVSSYFAKMLASDDVIYVSILALIIISGNYLRQISSVGLKQWISTICGLAIVYIVSGVHCLHPILVTLVNSAIILGFKKNSHVVSFIFCFSYLAIFRLVHMLEIIKEPQNHLNAVQMIHTLKMVGLAFEINDTRNKLKDDKNTQSELQYKCSDVNPSIMDTFHYAFCHVGLLTGPYYKFRTYVDWLQKPYCRRAPVSKTLISKLKILPMIIAALYIGSYFFPLEYAKDEIYKRSALYRWWYMTPLFFNFRMRLYTAFILSGCCCIANGLGMYPKVSKPKSGEGPTDFEALIKSDSKEVSVYDEDDYSFETIDNVDMRATEFVPTVRGGLRAWNKTVQYWLAMFVYKRVKKFRVAITMLTSAFWHGIYSGYYVGLLTVPFVLMAENAVERALRRDLSPQGQKVYDFFWWIIKMQAFSYMGMGFFLVYTGETIRYWASMYFSGHIIVAILFALGRFISSQKRPKRKNDENTPKDEKKTS